MSRILNKLNARKVVTIKTPGYHSDGGGLYLQVSPTLSKSWIFKFVRNKKATEIGLGSFGDISLEAAREQASEYRKLLKQGRILWWKNGKLNASFTCPSPNQ